MGREPRELSSKYLLNDVSYIVRALPAKPGHSLMRILEM